MVRLTLTQRIWFSFIVLIVSIGLIITIVYPFSLQKTLKEDSYEMIKQQQQSYIGNDLSDFDVPDTGTGFVERQRAARSVGHLVVVNGQGRLEGDPVPQQFLDEVADSLRDQESEMGEYEMEYQGATIFYVVRKIQESPNQLYLISYMWDTYRNQMMKKLWYRLLIIFGIAALISLALAGWLTRYLKNPLITLGRHFENIAALNWQKPFKWHSGDEFERLSHQFENMRRNLIQYDESQKQFLQRASHELKTPIMVIQSYAQSVKDGVYPKGTAEDSMEIIMDESARMEQRVQKLIYFAKVDSLRDEQPEMTLIEFGELADTIQQRFSQQRADLDIVTRNPSVPLYVDEEQWLVAIENLVENAVRYAKTTVRLSAEQHGDETWMIISNDGDPIPEDQLNQLFEPFYKGSKGQFGLGMAIVKRIVERHNGTITVHNDQDGVHFTVKIPSKDM
ncbi:sensor histidine kinase [Tuberibacillus sp. Marseille-P3662]|uniref:sensor histidine kinase n=1 Tax=Tuberibacillus sp. Marseille-P3662 TaxID=1965358 RepID=UPI000A1CA8B6|nr:HAMP domain-containing sensor histidine kinase [Tuberibacillus sp. Marseille-P3662]